MCLNSCPPFTGHSTSKTQHHHSSSEHQRAPVHSERVSSKTHERKSTTSNAAEKSNERATTPTYVYEIETNLSQTQTDSISSESIAQTQATNEVMMHTTQAFISDFRLKSQLDESNANNVLNASNSLTTAAQCELLYTPPYEDRERATVDAAPLPPPRTRRKRLSSLIPIPINPHTLTPPTKTSPPSTPSVPITYEHQIYAQIIPPVCYAPEPTYSNQSTLRKSSLQRTLRKRRSALPLPISFPCARKPSQTQSTTSSFAFLPYLPAAPGKRPSDASHIYHNYLLYATPAKVQTKPMSLTRPPAELAARLWEADMLTRPERPQRLRTMRSHVTTHHPFGLCTCS